MSREVCEEPRGTDTRETDPRSKGTDQAPRVDAMIAAASVFSISVSSSSSCSETRQKSEEKQHGAQN